MDENYRKSLEAMLLHVERINAAASQFSNLSQQMDFAHRVAEFTKQCDTPMATIQNQLSQLDSLRSPSLILASQQAALFASVTMPAITLPAVTQIQELASRYHSPLGTSLFQAMSLLNANYPPAMQELCNSLQTIHEDIDWNHLEQDLQSEEEQTDTPTDKKAVLKEYAIAATDSIQKTIEFLGKLYGAIKLAEYICDEEKRALWLKFVCHLFNFD